MKTAVLLAAYNSGEYLGQMLDSLLEQTFSDFSVYIHDDGSTDNTQWIITEYQKRYPGRFEQVEDKKHRGAMRSFFYLMKKVDADLYFFSDADDVWLPEKMERLIGAVSADDNVSVPAAAFCDMYVTDSNLNIMEESFIGTLGRDGNRLKYQEILIDNPAAGCAMCFNRPIRDLAVAPHVKLSRIPMHDKWVLVLAAVFGRAVYVDEPLVYYRQHGDNVMGADSESRIQKVKRNTSDLLHGRFIKNKREFLSESKMMARELLKYPDLPRDVKRVLKEFVMISRSNKIRRILFYKKHNFSRAQGDLWMRLWV